MMTAYKGLISFDLDDDAVKQLGKNTMIKVLDFVVVTSPIKTTIFQKMTNVQYLITSDSTFPY